MRPYKVHDADCDMLIMTMISHRRHKNIRVVSPELEAETLPKTTWRNSCDTSGPKAAERQKKAVATILLGDGPNSPSCPSTTAPNVGQPNSQATDLSGARTTPALPHAARNAVWGSEGIPLLNSTWGSGKLSKAFQLSKHTSSTFGGPNARAVGEARSPRTSGGKARFPRRLFDNQMPNALHDGD